MEEVLEQAKAIIREEVKRAGCEVRRIILFGSRARGDFRPDSDWDFYVVVDRELPYSDRWDVSDRIRLRFIRSGFSGDVFVQSEKSVEERKGNTGFLIHYVLKDGIEV